MLLWSIRCSEKDGSLRLVIDARRANCYFVDAPATELPTGAAFSQVRNVFRMRKTLFRGWFFGEFWVYALIREKFSQVRYLFLLYPWSYFPIFELNSSLINKPIYEYSLTILRGA